jgi:hypothetical protein
MISSSLLFFAVIIHSAVAIQYGLSDNFQGSTFYDETKFTYITADPSSGTYV